MKAFIILATLIATPVFADVYLKIDDIKGESTDTAAPVIDNEENAANDVKDKALHQPGGGMTGSTRQRADVKTEDISVTKQTDMFKLQKGNDELDKSSTKAPAATDYNSSRSNRTTRAPGNDETHTSFPKSRRDVASGMPTGKRQHRKLDTDDDDDGVDTVCNAVDNDCDDTTEDETK